MALARTKRDMRRWPRFDDAEQAAEAVAWARSLVDQGGDDREQLEQAIRLCNRFLRSELPQDLLHDVHLVRGIALIQVARCREALESFAQAQAIYPDSLEVALERGVALFELCRFDEAEPLFQQVADSEPSLPWPHYFLGLIAERRGELGLAAQLSARARKRSPFAVPFRYVRSDGEFDAAVDEALARLPRRLLPLCAGVPLEIEPLPALEDLLAVDPPLSPSILGLFRGAPLGTRGERSIVLYRYNLERATRGSAELVEQIAVTLLHEIGHLVGLSEEELWRRGLE